MTPPEVMAYRPTGSQPDTPGWTVRVVPNLYPALGPVDGEPDERADGVYLAMNGVGAHEVLVTGPQHVEEVARLPVEQISLMVKSYVDRLLVHRVHPNVQYVHIIMNYGREAGASREHPHSQLFAMPLIPGLVETELWGAGRHFEEQGSCVFCDMIRRELSTGHRVVAENDRFLVFAPYASRSPFELWMMPKEHEASFETMGGSDIASFAGILSETLGKLYVGLADPPFNYWIHTAPSKRDVAAYYHWHLEIVPKLSIAAGFELGTEVMINTALPETAAEFLRQTAPPSR